MPDTILLNCRHYQRNPRILRKPSSLILFFTVSINSPSPRSKQICIPYLLSYMLQNIQQKSMVLLRHKSSHMTDYMFSFKMILLSHFISDLRIIQGICLLLSHWEFKIHNCLFNNFFSVIAFCCGFSTCISFCDICCQSASAESFQWKLPVLCNACAVCMIDT